MSLVIGKSDTHKSPATAPPQYSAEEIASPLLQVVSLGPSASARLFLAKSLCVNSRYAEAMAELDAALRENPELAAAHCLKGLILAFRGDYSGARQHLEFAVRLGGHDQRLPEYCLALARVLCELTEWELALSAVEQAVQYDPNQANAHMLRGEILGLLQRPDDAVSAYRAALKINPLLTKARYKLGNLLLNQNRQDESLQQTILARRLEPADPNTRISLGNIFARLNRHEEAIKEYRVAVQLATPLGQALPLAKMGESYLALRQTAEAIAVFRAALERDPKQVSCYLSLASIYEQEAQYAVAIELLQAACKIDERFPAAAEELARLEQLAEKSGNTPPLGAATK